MSPRPRHLLAYFALGAGCLSVLAWILDAGRTLSVEAAPVAAAPAAVHGHSALSLLLLQAIVVIATARLCALAVSRFGQPGVIGEVIGGLMLGPSLLGALFPSFSAALFPPASLAPLQFLSQLGLIVFMFIVGLELDLDVLKERAASAVLVSHASIAVPFLMGASMALWLYGDYAPAGVPFRSFCLFLGIAMSITAFPVLARIIHEKGMTRTPIGALALTCAAVDDVSAWCILAFVVSIVRGGAGEGALQMLGWTAAYVASFVFAVRPILAAWIGKLPPERQVGQGPAVVAVVTLLTSAMFAELAGIHALFGAFLAGAIMPRGTGLRQRLATRLEDFCTVILLPLFFALTGLRTQIGLIDSSSALVAAAAVLAAATIGKVGASSLAARYSGMGWRESMAVGALMNTRGLMELVVLNIGYDLGVITPQLFTIFVLMAVLTTLMTGPLVSALLPETSAAADRHPVEP